MNVMVDRIDDVVVLKPCGGLWEGWETTPCREVVVESLQNGDRRFVVDLGESRLLNLAGVGALVALLTAIREAGGELTICNLGERARRAFAVTGLDRVFETHPTRDEALAAYGVVSRRAS